MYAKVAKYVKSRKDLTEDMLEGLEELVELNCYVVPLIGRESVIKNMEFHKGLIFSM